MTGKKSNSRAKDRRTDFPGWYQDIIDIADIAEFSGVRGCMIIKPFGYAIWERMQCILDREIKATGHENAYFPLFIPLSDLQTEAEHIDGFAKECAVVTHSCIEKKDGQLVPSGELTEPLIVRPTSEMVIGAAFSRWIKSYRDLPLLINQWANVVRWEMRPRLLLRTTEFLWQEGHTAHQTADEAEEETKKMLNIYEEFVCDWLAIPVIKGEKTDSERFPGAINTYSLEVMAQDGKAIQSGTSHFLGQNFSRASKIEFVSQENRKEFAWTTSWGVSTRLIGTLILVHGDSLGIRLPPRIAPIQIVFVPFFDRQPNENDLLKKIESIVESLKNVEYEGEKLRIHIDKRDNNKTGSFRLYSWQKKGIPLIIKVGIKDLDPDSNSSMSVCLRYRDDLSFRTEGELSDDLVFQQKQKLFQQTNCMFKIEKLENESSKFFEFFGGSLYDPSSLEALLERIQYYYLQHSRKDSLDFLIANMKFHKNEREFYEFFEKIDPSKPNIHAKFALTYWKDRDLITESDQKLNNNQFKKLNDHQIHICYFPEARCHSKDIKTIKQKFNLSDEGICPFTNQNTHQIVIFEKLKRKTLAEKLPELLGELQHHFLTDARDFLIKNIQVIKDRNQFYDFFQKKNSSNPEIQGGFALTYWSGCQKIEEELKKDLQVSIRCIPMESDEFNRIIQAKPEIKDEWGVCPFTGKTTNMRVIFAKSY